MQIFNMKEKYSKIILVSYLVVAFITIPVSYNTEYNCQGGEFVVGLQEEANLYLSVFRGAFWPIFWGIKSTKFLRPEKN